MTPQNPTPSAKRRLIHDKCNGRCAYCGEELNGKLQIDHVIPRRNFEQDVLNERVPRFLRHLRTDDLDHYDNLMPSCRPCNYYKSSFTLEIFRQELGKLTARLSERVVIYKNAKRFGLIQETGKDITFYFEQS